MWLRLPVWRLNKMFGTWALLVVENGKCKWKKQFWASFQLTWEFFLPLKECGYWKISSSWTSLVHFCLDLLSSSKINSIVMTLRTCSHLLLTCKFSQVVSQGALPFPSGINMYSDASVWTTFGILSRSTLFPRCTK